MKTLNLALLLVLTLLPSSRAEEARFFRISGPVASTITAFSADGYVTWTNAPTNATFTVQTVSSLLNPTNWVDYIQVTVTNPVTTHRLFNPNPPSGMAFIPAGSFTMGNTFSGEGTSSELPLHSVYVSAFYMDRYEVTKALWDDVYQWATNHGYSFEYWAAGKANNHPAQTMSWCEAVKWCNARSEKEGRVPAYYTRTTQTTVYLYRTGVENVQNDWVKWNAGYRLPTEAEWEKAARGGASRHRFPWTDADTITHSRANYISTTFYAYDISPTRGYHPAFNAGGFPSTSPVGYFTFNGYGLYDMVGNVGEWCWDWYGGYASGGYSGSQTDPRGPTGPISGVSRVVRGGGWSSAAINCRAADRGYGGAPTERGSSGGFRSVLPQGQ